MSPLLPLSKQAVAVVALARAILRLRPGDQMQPIGEWADQLGVGRGTVQAALRLLEDAQAVRLHSRARYGTRVEFLDYRRLWEVTGSHSVVGSMPLPYTLRYQGLATGLYRAFERADLPLQMAYMRGASLRLDGVLQNRYEFAITSRLAARSLLAKRPELEVAASFGRQSYTGEHVLVFARPEWRELRPGMKVGIDPLSYDQHTLTDHISRGGDVQLVPINYTQLLTMLTRGDLDAAVWNGDELADRGLSLGIVPLSAAGLPVQDENTEAVLVLRRDGLLRSFMEAHFEAGLVSSVQAEVLSGAQLPTF